MSNWTDDNVLEPPATAEDTLGVRSPRREIYQETLPNGVQVVLRPNHFTPAVAIQAWVAVGSLAEGPEERGMAHFIEHMLFKGTARRAVGEIAATIEGCGGEINAYTTFDQTVFHLTLAAPHAQVGVDLLCDAFANSSFDHDEFAREREVILEEIRRANDSPGAQIGKRVFELMFAGTEAGRPIIGSEAGLRTFTREGLYAFYRRWYVPANLTLVVVGDFEVSAMRGLIAEHFGAIPSKAPPPPMAWPRQTMVVDQEVRVDIVRGDFQQTRIEAAFMAPPLEHFDSTALDLAAFALGSGELSRLNRRLRDTDQTVTSIGASLYSPRFGGIFELSAMTEKDSVLAAVTGMAREVTKLVDHEPVSASELERARANLRVDRIYQEETVDGQAQAVGYGMRTPHWFLFDDVYLALVQNMPLAAVDAAVRRWLKPEAASLVLLVHNDFELSTDEVRAAWVAGTAPAKVAAKGPGPRAAIRKESATAAVVNLAPGLRLIYRHNPNIDLFTITAATEGGQRSESAATAGFSNALAGLLATASARRPYQELMEIVEGMGASLEGFSGKDSMGFQAQGLTEQARPLLSLLRECLLTPVFPQEQWQALRREIAQGLKNQADSPATLAVRAFQERLFGDHPYKYSLLGTEQSLAAMSPAVFADHWPNVLMGGPWVISVAATLPLPEVVDLVRAGLQGFTPQPERRSFESDQLVHAHQVSSAKIKIAKAREQTHIVYGFPGLTWADPDRAALDVLVSILGGHGGVLFRELRDRLGLAYAVSPIISYGCHPGTVGAYIACAPDKAERAAAAMREEILACAHTPPVAAEVDRARNYIIGAHDLGLQKSDAQTSTMALMEAYGLGYDDFMTYPRLVAKVTAEDVVRVAGRLLDSNRGIEVQVGPAS